MRIPAKSFSFITLTLLLALYGASSSAEIYKWVDAQGNVHFGDKPVNPKDAKDAEPVQLQESYTPSELDAAEQAQRGEQKLLTDESRERRQEQELVRAEEREEAKKIKAERCARLDGLLAKYTTTTTHNGRPLFYYLLDEDGNSVSQERQAEAVEELRAERQTQGCS